MTDIVERLLDFTTRDHERGCTGREYVCSCGYDQDIEAAVKKAAAEIERLRSIIGEYAHCRSCGSLVRTTGEYAFQCDCTKMGDDFAHLQRLGPHDKEAFDEIVKLHSEVSEARATGRREGMEERRLCAIDLWNQLVVLSGYHITRPPTPDHEFVQVCNGDLRKMIELMGRTYQPTMVGEQHPDNLDADCFAARIAAEEKEE